MPTRLLPVTLLACLICACASPKYWDESEALRNFERESWYDVNCGGARCGAADTVEESTRAEHPVWRDAARVTIGALVVASVTYGAYTVGKVWMAGESAGAAAALIAGNQWFVASELADLDPDWARYFREYGQKQTCWHKVTARSAFDRVVSRGRVRAPERGDLDRIGHRAVFCASLPGPVIGLGEDKIVVDVGRDRVELIQYDGWHELMHNQAKHLTELHSEGVPALQYEYRDNRWFAPKYSRLLRPEEKDDETWAVVRRYGNHRTVQQAKQIKAHVAKPTNRVGDFQVLFHDASGDMVIADPRKYFDGHANAKAVKWLDEIIRLIERQAERPPAHVRPFSKTHDTNENSNRARLVLGCRAALWS